MSVVLRVPIDAIEQARGELGNAIHRALRMAGNRIQKEGREITQSHFGRYSTGRLASSFKARISMSGLELTWGPAVDDVGVDYTNIVLHGAIPHIIVPKVKKKLHWYRDGIHHFRDKVAHPGYGGKDFVTPVAVRAREIVMEELISAIGAIRLQGMMRVVRGGIRPP